jgi:hypothetical protein
MTEENTDLVTEIMGEETKPEAPEEPKVEPKAEEKPAEPVRVEEPKSEPDVEKKVNHGALHEERERRKELQRKLEQESSERKKLEERVSKMQELYTAPRQEDVYVDPVEQLKSDIQKVSQKVDGVYEKSESDNKADAEKREFFQKYTGSVQAFVKDQPDFDPKNPDGAYQFLIKSRERELSKIIKDPAKLAQRLAADEQSIVIEAYASEENPAKVMYELAVERGYKKKSAEVTQPVKTIEQVDKALEASKSLSPGGQPDSSSGLEKMSAREIGELSDEEFDRLWKDAERRGKRRA